MKSEFLQIRVSESEKEGLNFVAAKLETTVSQIVREAIREKVIALKRKIADEATERPQPAAIPN